jgi:hypothetical protein
MTFFRRLLVAVSFVLLSVAALADDGVLSRTAVLREQPSQDAAKIRSLAKGDEVEVLSAAPENGFVRVRTEDSVEGWVLAKFVHPAPPAEALLPEAAATEAQAATTISTAWQKPAPQAGKFTLDGKTCGLDGSGDKRDKGTNVRKNRTDIPTTYHAVTWKAIAGLAYPAPAPKSRENFTPEQLAEVAQFEGAAVETVGYVVAIKPQASNSESCNCGWHGEAATDWHIALVEHPGDGEASSVVVEPTPRLKKNHPGWTKKNLTPWLNGDVPVRISGWLLFDPQHTNHLKKYRSTLWEIHPITKIEVWDTDTQKWVDLDDVKTD